MPSWTNFLAEIAREQEGVQNRLEEIQESANEPEEPISPELLEELRLRLDKGLDDVQRQEVVRLLVKQITRSYGRDP